MSKHTPGPWILASNPKQILFKVEGHPYRLLAEAHHAVFNDGTGQGSLTDEEVKANARLIAAAPDLLEALKAYADSDDCDADGAPDANNSRHWETCRWCRAQATIAKAEGVKNE